MRPPFLQPCESWGLRAQVVGSAQSYLAAISHVVAENVTAHCTDATNRIVVQQFAADRPIRFVPPDNETETGCVQTVDLGKVLSVYGSMYEIEFFNNGTVRKEVNNLLVLYTRYMLLVVPAAFVLTLFAHEGDFRRVWYYLIRDQKLHVT